MVAPRTRAVAPSAIAWSTAPVSESAWEELMTGPMIVWGSLGSPTFSVFTLATNFSVNSSAMSGPPERGWRPCRPGPGGSGEVAAEDRRVDGVVDVRVVEDHQGAVAAELQHRALEVRGADGGDVAADLVGAGEGDDLRYGVLDEGVADLGDVGDDDVEQTAGQARVLEDLRHQGAADDRGVLVRLEDHAVAERQGRRDGLQGEQEGEVEKGLITPTTPTGTR